MKVLVTGANGQLGQEIIHCKNQYPTCDFHFYTKNDWDITDLDFSEEIIFNSKADYLINTSAYTKVDLAEDEKELCNLINAKAPAHLASLCRDAGMRFIHYSTDYVFNSDECIPIRENTKKRPKGVYAESKSLGEDLIMSEYPDSMIIRTSWLYSSFGNNFVKTMIKLAKSKDSLNIVSDQTGNPTYARDLAMATLTIISSDSKRSAKNLGGFYHYCNTGSCTWFEFAQEIFHYLHISIQLNKLSTEAYGAKAWRPIYSSLDCRKIQQEFNLKIPDWKTSLHKCLETILSNEPEIAT